MNYKTLQEIDYFRIRDEIAKFCVSPEGEAFLKEREPFNNVEKIEFYKNCSREWCAYLQAVHNSPLSGWENAGALIPVIKTNGASLSLEQLRNLGQFVLSAKNLRDSVLNHYDELKLKVLYSEVKKIPLLENEERIIFRVIMPDGELRDLPELQAIRAEIASLNSKIKNIIKKITSDSKYAPILESSVPVLRNGRQVLAVKASLQNRIPGLIHEVSQTGQTVYVEPEDAVICSNQLIQKENELDAEIKRILREVTRNLQPSIPVIKDLLPLMKDFDSTIAAAKWGMENKCSYALTSIKEPPLLLKACHPLLKEKAVPIDLRFYEGKRVLIITGPNTGGKTVTLKTFALLSMLNQSGFPIPCAEGSRLPVFSNVFADIGDDQSLDQSLSTFSGHMKNIAHAITSCKDDTLILLDELGSGTDPQEGTAISMAVLDKLIEKGSFVLVTTHQGILKNYGYTNPSCINASVEFDTTTLSPSYHLLMGVPGESHALDIALKSGLPREICTKARNYIATEQADVSALIKGLNQKHVELSNLQKKTEAELKMAEEKSLKLKEKELELKRKEHELKEGKQQEMHDFLVSTRRQLENLVRELREGELTRDKTVGVKDFISNLEKNTNRIDDKIEKEEELLAKKEEELRKELEKKANKYTSNKKTKKKTSNKEALSTATTSIFAEPDKEKKLQPQKPLIFESGAFVKSKNGENEGKLIEKTSKNAWNVQFGSVKIQMKEKDLILIRKSAEEQNKASYVLDSESLSPENSDVLLKEKEKPVFELRLLGMYSSEAIRALEHQIDLCVLNNFPHFSVIHGKGDGVLQQVVRDYLSNCPVVKDFEYASAEDGGAGKTYVTLK